MEQKNPSSSPSAALAGPAPVAPGSRLLDKVAAQVDVMRLQAQQQAQAQTDAARTAANALISTARTNADVVTGRVHDYYFSYRFSASVWTPSSSKTPVPFAGTRGLMRDIAVDEENGLVIWPQRNTGTIMTAQLDGTQVNCLYNTMRPESVACDPQGNAVFWACGHSRIMKGDMKGSTPSQFALFPSGSRYQNVAVLKIDAARDVKGQLQVFWADGQQIYRVSARSAPVPLLPYKSGYTPVYVAVDPVNKLVFWLDWNHQCIYYCDFDGRNVQPHLKITNPVGLRALRIDPYTFSLYYIYRARQGRSYWLYKYGGSGSQPETLMEIGPMLDRGLALKLSATSQALRAAQAQSAAAQAKAATQLQNARAQRDLQVAAAQQGVVNAQASADNLVAQARALGQQQQARAQARLDQNQSRAALDLARSQTENASKLARAQAEADQRIAQAKERVAENEKEANSRLDEARAALRQLGQ